MHPLALLQIQAYPESYLDKYLTFTNTSMANARL